MSLFLYVLAQSLLGAAVIGYSQAVMRRLGAARWLRVTALAACGICAVYCDNITVILKDVPYSYAVLLLLCETARLVFLDGEEYGASAGFLLRTACAGMLMLGLRNNGLAVLLPTGILLAVRMRRNRRTAVRVAAVILLPVLLTSGMKRALFASRDVQPGSLREVLSLPFQQTARFARVHGEDIPDEEWEAIDRVLDAQEIGRLYNEFVSDPVKATYKEDADADDLLAYFGVWFRQMLRDPLCYAQATLAQNALLFDPQTRNVAVFEYLLLDDEAAGQIGAVKPERLWKLTDREQNLRELLFAMPFYAQLSSVGFFCILLAAAAVIARRERAPGMGLMLTPGMITMLMIILGPCLYQQDRYGFPIVYGMPLILACLGYALRKTAKEEKTAS